MRIINISCILCTNISTMSKINPTYITENDAGGVYGAGPVVNKPPVSLSRPHSCTDPLCLILFVIFAVGQAVLSIIIYSSGANPTEFLLPHDSNGATCRSPLSLFYLDIVSCINVDALLTACKSTSVCVSDCPPQNLYYLIPNHRQIMYQQYCQITGLKSYFGPNLPSSVDQSTYYTLASKGICPLYTIASTSLFSRCIPTFLSSSYNQSQTIYAIDSITNQSIAISDFTQTLNFGLVAQGVQYIVNLMNIKTFGNFCSIIL